MQSVSRFRLSERWSATLLVVLPVMGLAFIQLGCRELPEQPGVPLSPVGNPDAGDNPGSVPDPDGTGGAAGANGTAGVAGAGGMAGAGGETGVGGPAGAPGGAGADGSGGAPVGDGSGGTTNTGGSPDPTGAAGAAGSPMMPSPKVDIFDETRVHDIKLTMSPEDWQSIIDDSRGDEWRHASFSYDGVAIEDIGVRPSGESSRFAGNVKMSVRVKFDAFTGTGKFGGLEEVKIGGMWDDPSKMRDRLAYFFYRAVMPAPREVHGTLTVNGQPRGLYAVEEVWDDEAIKHHFPAPIGPLYRIRGLPMMDPYLFRGTDPATYVPVPWDAKGKHPMEDHVVIGPFLKVLNETPAALEQVTDVENLLAFFAASAVVTNTDGFNANFEVEDHFQYYDPSTKRFSILPWDPDNTFGSTNDPPDRSIYARFSKSRLPMTIRDTPALRSRYKAKLTAVMAKVPLATLQAEADRIYQQIKTATYADTLKMSTDGHFDYSLQYIKDFAAARYASIQEQVAHGP